MSLIKRVYCSFISWFLALVSHNWQGTQTMERYRNHTNHRLPNWKRSDIANNWSSLYGIFSNQHFEGPSMCLLNNFDHQIHVSDLQDFIWLVIFTNQIYWYFLGLEKNHTKKLVLVTQCRYINQYYKGPSI